MSNKTFSGTCVRCKRKRGTLRTAAHCYGCFEHLRWHRATSLQTVLPTTLHAGDVLVRFGARFHIHEVRLIPCELAPSVFLRTRNVLTGAFRTMSLPSEDYVAVEALDASAS